MTEFRFLPGLGQKVRNAHLEFIVRPYSNQHPQAKKSRRPASKHFNAGCPHKVVLTYINYFLLTLEILQALLDHWV